MVETWLEGVRLYLPDNPEHHPNALQMSALRASINLVPIFHAACIERVEVRGPNQYPRRGGGNDADAGIIRLSHACLSEAYNEPFNITMLHELGHIVDRAYGVTAYVQRLGTESARALLATEHAHREGGTDGPGERIADCYMYYLLNELAEERAGGPPYQGNEGKRRFKVLLASPAFSNSSGQRRT
jgi:hypothetical protein